MNPATFIEEIEQSSNHPLGIAGTENFLQTAKHQEIRNMHPAERFQLMLGHQDMNTERPTPETDAHPLWHGEPAVAIDFARRLERERDEARELQQQAEVIAVKKGRENAALRLAQKLCIECDAPSVAELTSLERERDEAREQLETSDAHLINAEVSIALLRAEIAKLKGEMP